MVGTGKLQLSVGMCLTRKKVLEILFLQVGLKGQSGIKQFFMSRGCSQVQPEAIPHDLSRLIIEHKRLQGGKKRQVKDWEEDGGE